MTAVVVRDRASERAHVVVEPADGDRAAPLWSSAIFVNRLRSDRPPSRNLESMVCSEGAADVSVHPVSIDPHGRNWRPRSPGYARSREADHRVGLAGCPPQGSRFVGPAEILAAVEAVAWTGYDVRMSRIEVSPSLLRWAQERSGADSASLERKFPHLEAWERGEVRPTLKQLERFAKATSTPIGYLFLAEPPTETVPIPDFRTIADRPLERPSPDLLDTIYLCQQRQDWYRDHLRVTGYTALPFVGSVRLGASVVETAATIRHALGLDLSERSRLSTWTEALRRLVDQAESLGVLVMVSGVVGSNTHRKLDPDEFRGFALAEGLAPLVFINGADSKAAQMFTLAHELAHLWIGESGVSDAEALRAPEHRVERWCNRVAAEILVPLASLRGRHDPEADLEVQAQRLARDFKVSGLVILRRMHDAGLLDRESYWNAYEREIERSRSRPPGSGGDFYRTLGVRTGKGFARAVVISALEGRTPFTEAFRLLGFKKMASFDELARRLGILA